MRLALVGHPNCGKSTLFGALTHRAASVGNYPGTTIAAHRAALALPDGQQVELMDLPGCNSLMARSPEERLTFAELSGQGPAGAPDAVLLVLDATQLERGLYLLLQLQEMGLPTLLALNMVDRTGELSPRADAALLQRSLGQPVIPVAARSGQNLAGLRQALAQFCAALPRLTGSVLAPHLQLATDEQAALGALQASLPPRHQSVGMALWLLCAEPERAAAQLRQLGCAERTSWQLARAHQAVGGGQAQGFAQKLIARRYASIDRLLAHAPAGGGLDSRRLDRWLLHPQLGPGLFLAAMFVLFQLTFRLAAPLMEAVGGATLALTEALGRHIPGSLTASLWRQGLGPGLANVLSFVPQIGLLFFGIALLEDSGYMARAAFVADALMRRVGLQGRAFVPLLSSFACAVPGVMACRTLASRSDRLLTIFIAPLMSCSARLPVYTLVIGAVFADARPLAGFISVGGLLIFAMYALGFGAALGTAWLLRRSVLPKPAAPLLLELPRLQWPSLGAALRQTQRRCTSFLVAGGPPILALSVLLWAAQQFPQRAPPPAQVAASLRALPAAVRADPQARQAALAAQARAYALDHSLAGRVGHAIEPLIAPLGFDWRIGVALVASFAAREVLVSALAQIYAASAADPGDAAALGTQLQRHFTPLTGLSLMVFFVLAMQCFSTVAVVRRETGTWRWPLLQLGYMNALAYLASLLVYQGGRALGYT